MLRAYQPITHDIFKAHELIEYLVYQVWCKADDQPVEDKLNEMLTKLYEDGRLKSFKKDVDDIYAVCKDLNDDEKKAFAVAFENNNQIKKLCEGDAKPIALTTLNKKLVEKIEPFFKGLYTGFLDWKTIYEAYGTKKDYYDQLNFDNRFKECPCCGYGDLKTIYSKGRSAFDHYLPQKHYPFSATNFHNLIPICTTCNSDEKGEDDVLEMGKALFYPFEYNTHPKIEVTVDVKVKSIQKLIEEERSLEDKIKPEEIVVDFNLKGDEKVESWDRIFSVRERYFGKIADNRVSWFDDVREAYRDPDLKTDTVESAFDKIIGSEANKQLGFLKAPYLESIKAKTAVLKAITEVSGDSKISTSSSAA